MTYDITPYSTATEMLAALRANAVSAQELYALHRARIEERNEPLNAIVINTFDRGKRRRRKRTGASPRARMRRCWESR